MPDPPCCVRNLNHFPFALLPSWLQSRIRQVKIRQAVEIRRIHDDAETVPVPSSRHEWRFEAIRGETTPNQRSHPSLGYRTPAAIYAGHA